MAEYRGTSAADTLDQAALGLPDYSNIFGLGGDDTITIGRGIALGGEGNDTLIGVDGLQSGAGYFENAPAGFVADLATGVVRDGWGTIDTLTGIAQLHGSFRDDVMLGNGLENRLHPNGGHDRLDGRGGVDTVWLGGKRADYRVDVSTDGNSATIVSIADPRYITDIVSVERIEFQSREFVFTADLIDPVKLATQGLIAGDSLRWNAGQPMGTAIEVTFSFMTSAGTTPVAGFQVFDSAQRNAVKAIFADTAALTGLTFREVDEASGSQGQIRLGISQQPSTKGLAIVAGQPGAGDGAGDILMDTQSVAILTPGSEGFAALRHEIGHALGLRHPRNYDNGDYRADQFRAEDDHAGNTVMSDTAALSGLYRQTWGPLDVIALRTLYGAKAVGTDDNTYAFNDDAGAGLGLLIDDGGLDVLDFSALTTDARIDLRPSHHSSAGRTADGAHARDNLAIAAGTFVESAIGTALDDVLIGNDSNNRLQGGTGNDLIDGGLGIDTAAYTQTRSQYRVSVAPGQLGVIAIDGAGGYDSLTSVETLAFSDVQLPVTYQRTALAPGPGKDPGFLFDPIFYLLSNTASVATPTASAALAHYRDQGARLGAAPTAWFEPAYYSARWADLAPLNLDNATLFAHFNLFGVWEGRSPGSAFDGFDGSRYLRDYPDVAAYVNGNLADFLGSQTNGAIAHFILFGANEQRLAYDTNGGTVDVGYIV